MPSSQTFLPATPLTSDLWASSSSSDEYTSDSDSPLKSLPAKPLSARPDRLDEFKWAKEPEHIDRTPRKLRKARECLRHSLICALALHSSWPPPRLENGDVLRHSLFPRASHRGRSSVGEIPYPWAGLADRIILLNGYADDTKISESPSFRACLRVFVHLCSAHVVPLARSRTYVRDDISKSEAKAVPAFLKHFQELSERLQRDTDHRSDSEMDRVLENCPMEILYRVIGLALPTSHDQVGVLDLGNLPYESPQLVLDALDPRELDLHCLLEVFAVMPANVTGLILDHSDLHRLPNWTTSLQGIRSLRISGNTNLQHLPFSLLKLNDLRRIDADQVPAIPFMSTTIVLDGRPREVCRRARDKWRPRSQARPRLSAPWIGVRGLAEVSMIKAIEAFEADPTFWDLVETLGPNLTETISSYIRCEWCGKIYLKGYSDYVEEPLELRYNLRLASAPGAPKNRMVSMNLKGTICRPCRQILMGDSLT